MPCAAVFRLVACAVLALSVLFPGAASAAPAAPEDNGVKLLKMVALVRHGARAPLQSPETLALWSQKPWPQWPVEPGELTPRGAELVRAQWHTLRESLAWSDLLPVEGCPGPGDVYVYADSEQRTRATAAALLEGLAPGCGLGYLTRSPELPGPDPLFHPVAGGLCHPDHGSLAAETALVPLEGALRPDLDLMARLTGPAAPALCQAYGLSADCSFAALPTRLVANGPGGYPYVEGALPVGSSLAEIWLLEAVQWPEHNPAWGALTPDGLLKVLPVHTREFNAIQRAPSVAGPGGSALLAAMSTALTGTHPDPAVNAASLVVFVGHDTSLAHVAALLCLHWRTGAWPADAVPPGATLLLGLWRTADGRTLVRAGFAAQDLGTMLSSDPQVLRRAALGRAELEFALPDPADKAGFPLRASLTPEEFAQAVDARLNRACLPR